MPPTHDRDTAPSTRLSEAARTALAAMADEFGGYLQEDLGRLRAARATWRAGRDAGELRRVAHDLRGLAGLYGAPVAGRIAASLDRLLGAGVEAPALVNAHVDAVLAVVREGAHADGDTRGEALAAALEAAVRAADTPVGRPQAA